MPTQLLNYDLDVDQMEEPFISPEYKSQKTYSHDEFWTLVYKDLGRRFGLNDIRQAAE